MNDNVISSKKGQLVDCDRFFVSDNQKEKYLRRQEKDKERLERNAAKFQKIKEKILEIVKDDCTIDEICFRADIYRTQYYELLKHDPDFASKLSIYRASAKTRARNVVMSAIDAGDVETSKWYLERKAKDEFGKDNKDLGQINITITSEHAQKILELDTEPDIYQIDSNE